MKSTVFVVATLAAALLSSQAEAALIAYWNFNGLSIATASPPGSGGVPLTIPADQGIGLVSLAGYAGTVDDFAGTTINAIGADPAEESLSLIAGGTTFPGNGTFVDFSFSTFGLEDVVLTYAQQRTATGFNSNAWSFSTDGGANFTPVVTNALGAAATTFAAIGTVTVDMSGFSGIENQAAVIVRLTVNGASTAAGNNRFDNIQFNARPIIPEPATLAMGSFALLCSVAIRRRH
jgi:hypothetical protein